MTSPTLNEVMLTLGGHWQINCWRLPERDAQSDIVGHVQWSPGRGSIPEPGGRRGLLFPPDAMQMAGREPDRPLLIVETAVGLVAGYVGGSRPHLLGSLELLSALASGRHIVVVAGGTGGGVLASSKICATVEGTAKSCVVIQPPVTYPSLAAWLGTISSHRRARCAVLARVERARQGVM